VRARELEEAHVPKAAAREEIGGGAGAGDDVLGGKSRERDARDADEALELVDVFFLVRLVVARGLLGGGVVLAHGGTP
jgi:hypothetical protein